MEASVQGIFREGIEGYRQRHGMSLDQHRAAQAIMDCGTDALGREEWVCREDGHIEAQPHSCRHRSCPRCQSAYTQTWMEKTQARLLPCDHYHVVFTLPHELKEVWQHNRRWSADHLFRASAETLRQLLTDERYLGGEVGLLSSLHTWGRTLAFHPHVHVLVTGGGLVDGHWRGLEKDYLLPVGVLKAKFRGKWLSWLNAAYETGELVLPGHWRESDWKRTLRKVSRKSWNVRIEGPYRHGRGVVNYLSRYVHGGPIKDPRVIEGDGDRVCFGYRDHHDGRLKTMSLPTDQFLHRVLSHVAVKGQHNVRYYGMYVPGARTKRDLIRKHLGERAEEAAASRPKMERICPVCGGPLLHHLSTRRRISYIENNTVVSGVSAVVQQGVQAAPPWQRYFFGPADARLN